MADPDDLGSAPDRPEEDGRLVRRLRWRLVAWSAGSTLAVFVVLGTVIYGLVASALAASAEAQLRDRAAALLAGAPQPIVGTGVSTVAVAAPDGAAPGVTFGGPYSGTLAVVLPAGGAQAGPLDAAGFDVALTGGSVIRDVVVGGAVLRVLSEPIGPSPVVAVVQVAADRTAEDRTLSTLLLVLVVGGVAVFVVSGALGYVYAARAVGPIRESMRRQRAFAADTSHELRTPLAIIRGSVEHLRRHEDQPVGQVGEALDDLETETAHIGQLVDDLLLLARTDAGATDVDRVRIDLADPAAEALGGLQRLAADHDTRLELDAEPASIVGDPVRLRRLVTILVDNALRHGRRPDGAPGTVRVVVRPGASLEVHDDGPGIREEDLPRVFDRFWRAADATPGGSGLGLAIAAWIVDRHDGRIVVRERPGGGTIVRVSLPGA